CRPDEPDRRVPPHVAAGGVPASLRAGWRDFINRAQPPPVGVFGGPATSAVSPGLFWGRGRPVKPPSAAEAGQPCVLIFDDTVARGRGDHGAREMAAHTRARGMAGNGCLAPWPVRELDAASGMFR